MRPRSFVIAAAVLTIVGCDSKPRDPPPDIIKSQRQVMDKAKGVEQVLQKSADERREQADQPK